MQNFSISPELIELLKKQNELFEQLTKETAKNKQSDSTQSITPTQTSSKNNSRKRVYGEGSFYYIEKRNKWRFSFSIKDSVTNKPIRKYIYADSKRECIEKYQQLMCENENFKFITTHGISLSTLAKIVLDNKLKSNIISEGVYNRNLSTLKELSNSFIGPLNVQDITYKKLQKYFDSLITIYRDSSIKKLRDMINQALRYAIKEKYIPSNPLDDVLIPKSKIPTKEIVALTMEEQEVFSQYLINTPLEVEHYKNVFLLQLYTGMRIGEVLALTENDIDLNHNLIHVRRSLTNDKTGKVIMGSKTKTYAGKRDITIKNDLLKQIIIEQILSTRAFDNREKLLFIYDGHYVHQHSMNTQLKRILKNLNITRPNISTHTLRHTYATRAIESGMPAVVLAKLMGHTDVKVTLNTYTSIFNSVKEEKVDTMFDYLNSNNLLKRNENYKLEDNQFQDKDIDDYLSISDESIPYSIAS